MENYDERNIFVNMEHRDHQNNSANLEFEANIYPDKDNVSDIEMNNNLFNLNSRGILTSSIRREIFESREFRGFFQDIEPEKFSNIFLEKNLELSNDESISLFSVKQNFITDSKEVIPDNALSKISNIHNEVINSVLADDMTTASSLRKPCSLQDIRDILFTRYKRYFN